MDSSLAEKISEATLLADEKELVTFELGEQLFGAPVEQVEAVLTEPKITRVPLAASQLSGVINLRGRIATAIDLRNCLQLPPSAPKGMLLVTEHKGELFALKVDRVGEVMHLSLKDYEPNTASLEAKWQSVAVGIYRLPTRLLIALEIPRLIDLVHRENVRITS